MKTTQFLELHHMWNKRQQRTNGLQFRNASKRKTVKREHFVCFVFKNTFLVFPII